MQSTDAISSSLVDPILCGEGSIPERQVATGVTTVPIGEGARGSGRGDGTILRCSGGCQATRRNVTTRSRMSVSRTRAMTSMC